MSGDQFEMTAYLLKGIVSQCAMLPLEDFRNECDRYTSFGCFTMRPQEWTKGLAGVEEMREMADLALAIKRFAVKHDEQVKAG